MNRLLVIIEEGKEDQPALEQALAWAKLLQNSGQKPSIQLLLSTFEYAAQINKMVRGTVLNNVVNSVVKVREQWLTDLVGRTVEKISAIIGPLDIAIDQEVVWEKRTFKALEKVLQESQQEDNQSYDLVFKSLKEHPLHERLLMQIEEWQIVRVSDIPVMLVREPNLTQAPLWITAIDPEHPNHDSLNAKVVNTVKSVQGLLGGELTLIHANPSISEEMAPLLSLYNGGEQIFESITEEEVTLRLDNFMDEHQLDKSQLTIVTGPTEQVINAHARQFPNSVVVLGSRAKSGLADRWVGHVAEAIIDSSESSILVIKSNDEMD